MENPATWGPAERAVQEAMDDYYEDMRANPDLVGLSVIRRITDALRKAGELPAEPATPKQATATQNAQAFAALTAIQHGEWDRYLLRLQAATRMRLKTEEYRGSGAIDAEVTDMTDAVFRTEP